METTDRDGAATKVRAIIASQTSVKAVEIVVFEKVPAQRRPSCVVEFVGTVFSMFLFSFRFFSMRGALMMGACSGSH